MATFNSAQTIFAAIESIKRQAGLSVEILIADGNSTDQTLRICQSFGEHINYLLSEPDSGVYDAWNKLIPHARGRWICFIGSDDEIWSADTMAKMVAAADTRPNGCRLVYGQVHYYRADGTHFFSEGRPWDQCAREMRFRNSIPHIGTLHHRSIFDEGTRFDPSYRIAGDYNLIRREAMAHGAHFCGFPVARASWGGLSTRPDLELKSIREVGRLIRAQDGRRPPWIWYVRRCKVGVRHLIFRLFGERGLEAYDAVKRVFGRGYDRQKVESA